MIARSRPVIEPTIGKRDIRIDPKALYAPKALDAMNGAARAGYAAVPGIPEESRRKRHTRDGAK